MHDSVFFHFTRINRMKLFKLLLAVAGATVFLGALVSTASAVRLSSSSQTFRAGYARVDFIGGFGTTECPLTLEGSFHRRTIAKEGRILIGFLTRAILGTCTEGAGTILTATLPWHIRYASFSGTLPNITAINTDVAGLSFQITEPVFGVTCLASNGTITMTYNRVAAGALTTAVLSGRSPTNCGLDGTISGTSNSFTVLGAATRITVTLI
jgi:uncharacterized membrane protein